MRPHQAQRQAFASLRGFIRDLGTGSRRLRLYPFGAISIILVLGIAIGASVAVFSLADAVLFAPPPISNPGRVLIVTRTASDGDALQRSPGAAYAAIAGSSNFSSVASATDCHSQNLAWHGGTSVVLAQRVTPGYFPLLGVTPLLGHVFRRADEASAVISYGLFTTRFASDPHVLGSTIRMNGGTFTIIGVMPPGFQLQTMPAEVWLPLNEGPQLYTAVPGEHDVYILGRIRPGVPKGNALANIAAVGERLSQRLDPSDRYKLVGLTLQDFRVEVDRMGSDIQMLAVMAVFILLIGCASASGLLLCQLERRRHEIALRVALGASSGQIVSRIIAEVIWLALATIGVGLAIGEIGMRIMSAGLSWTPYSAALRLHVDARVLGFAAICGMVSLILASSWPARLAGRTEPLEALNVASHRIAPGRSSTRRFLSSAAIALSLAAVAWSTVFAQYATRTLARDPGYPTRGIVFIDVTPPRAATRPDYFESILTRVGALPGVGSAAFVNDPPPGHFRQVEFGAGNSGILGSATAYTVSNGYVQTLGLKLLRGRTFRPSDTASGPRVALVNQTLNSKIGKGESGMGRFIIIKDGERRVPYRIIGIVGPVRDYMAEDSVPPQVYFSLHQRPVAKMTLAVRSLSGAALDYQSITSAIWGPVGEMGDLIGPERTAHDYIERTYGGSMKFTAGAIGSFATLAVFIVMFGLYSVIRDEYQHRSREIAIRAALGANRRQLASLVFGSLLRGIWPGTLLGVAFAFAIVRSSSAFIDKEPSWGLAGGLVGGAAVIVLISALLAVAVPAVRIVFIDSATSLSE